MICDSLMLRRMTAELQELRGAHIGRVFPTARAEFVLDFSGRRALPQVVINVSAELGRLHRDEGLEPARSAESPLADVLRRHLKGATFLGAVQQQFDRVLRLEFTNAEGLGLQSRRSLVAEIMGRHSNLLLLDEREYILECARHVTTRVNRVRQSLPGEEYVPPPDFGKLDPTRLTLEGLQALLPTEPRPVAEWLRQVIQGASDLFLLLLCERLGLDSTTPTDELESLQLLHSTLQQMLQEAGETGPGYLATPPGKAPVAYPLPLPSDWEQLGELDSLSQACSVLYRKLAQAGQARQLRQRLTAVLEAACEKAARREAERQSSLDKAAHAEIYRQQGEMLLAHLHQLVPQQREITLPTWDGEGEVTIRLDPQLSPQQNAQAYFSRYKKMQRVKQRVPALLAEARQAREDLEDLLDQTEAADLDELRVLEQELVNRGLLKAPRRRLEVKADFRRTETADGYTLIYGRSGLENAAVLRASRPDDLWFHVQGAPGGHVVIRTDNRPEQVPHTTLLEAARLAARQSRRRRDTAVEVDYTTVKHLTRTKGAAPGHVIYREFKTLLVQP